MAAALCIAFHLAAKRPQSCRFTVRNPGTGESRSVDLVRKGRVGGFTTSPDAGESHVSVVPEIRLGR